MPQTLHCSSPLCGLPWGLSVQVEWLIQTCSPSVPLAQEELGQLLAAKTSLGLPLNPELWGLMLTEDRWGKVRYSHVR